MDDDLFYRLAIVGRDDFASGYTFFKVTSDFINLVCGWNCWIPYLFQIITFYSWTDKTNILTVAFPMSYDKKTPGLVFVVAGRSNFYPFPSSREKHQFYLFHQPSRWHHHCHHHDQERKCNSRHGLGVEKVSVTITLAKIFKAWCFVEIFSW